MQNIPGRAELGRAELPFGTQANQEIGEPGEPGSAELPFGTQANREIGEPGEPGRAELPFGNSANQEIGEPGEPGEPGSAELPFGTSANQEIGEPGEPGEPEKPDYRPYWHSRGYLPHYENPAVIQHITFHLADSLPKAALERMESELLIFSDKRREEERRKRIEALRDAGYGACVLRIPEIAQIVQDALFYFDGQRYRLIAWVVMPNHVHVLFQPLHNWTVAKIVASWKKFTARQINEYQRRTAGIANLPIGNSANQEIGDPGDPAPVWQQEYWDRYMRNETHMRSAIEYIHQNPVKAGLVARAEEWLWSSAYSGIANLPIGPEGTSANQEIGEPGRAELPFGNSANQEIGEPGRAELPFGTSANQEIGDPNAGESK